MHSRKNVRSSEKVLLEIKYRQKITRWSQVVNIGLYCRHTVQNKEAGCGNFLTVFSQTHAEGLVGNVILKITTWNGHFIRVGGA
jgi:hypothetical protein